MARKRKTGGPKLKHDDLEHFDRFMADVIEAPKRLAEATVIIAELIEKLGGCVTINLDEGRRVQRQYTLGIECNSENPKDRVLRLYARPATDNRGAHTKDA